MKIYKVNGELRWFNEGEAPEGAVLVTKQKIVPVKEVKPENKTVKKAANKSKKAEGTK